MAVFPQNITLVMGVNNTVTWVSHSLTYDTVTSNNGTFYQYAAAGPNFHIHVPDYGHLPILLRIPSVDARCRESAHIAHSLTDLSTSSFRNDLWHLSGSLSLHKSVTFLPLFAIPAICSIRARRSLLSSPARYRFLNSPRSILPAFHSLMSSFFSAEILHPEVHALLLHSAGQIRITRILVPSSLDGGS